MCDRFKFPTARAMLPPNMIYDFLWLPNADGSYGPPPLELIDLIVTKYHSLVAAPSTSASPTVSSVTAKLQEMRVDSTSKPASSPSPTLQPSVASTKSSSKSVAPPGTDKNLYKLAEEGNHQGLLILVSTYDVTSMIDLKKQ